MDITKQYEIGQEKQRLYSKIFSFFESFCIGTLLNSNGIRKQRGVSPLTIFTTIFALPFQGVNL